MRIQVGLLILVCFFYAAEDAQATAFTGKPMVGLGLTSMNANFNGIQDDQDETGLFKLGMSFPDTRIYAEWSVQSWNEADTVMIKANYERLFDLMPGAQSFVGFNAGLTDLDLLAAHQQKDYATGPGIGLQSGVLLNIYENWYLELGARYSRYWVDLPSALVGEVSLEETHELFASFVFSY